VTYTVAGEPDAINRPALGALMRWHVGTGNDEHSDEIGRIWAGLEPDLAVLEAELDDLTAQTSPPLEVVQAITALKGAIRRANLAELGALERLDLAYNPEQPRDSGGKFGSGGETVGRDLVASGAIRDTPAWNAVADPDKEFGAPGGINESGYGHMLAHDVGFDGLPRTVTEADLQKAITGGATELWRGVASAEHADQLRSGENFVGRGIFGDGLYFANGHDNQMTIYGSGARPDERLGGGREIAAWYARAQSQDRDDPAMVHAALSPDARVIAQGALEKMQYSEVPRSTNPTAAQLADPAWRAAEEIRTNDRFLLADLGRYGMAKGYDAISVARGPGQAAQHVVLNRSKLLVSSETIRP
jgi:hypothetical protein